MQSTSVQLSTHAKGNHKDGKKHTAELAHKELACGVMRNNAWELKHTLTHTTSGAMHSMLMQTSNALFSRMTIIWHAHTDTLLMCTRPNLHSSWKATTGSKTNISQELIKDSEICDTAD